MTGAFRRASHHCINKKVTKTEIVLSAQALQSAVKIYYCNCPKLKLSKVYTFSKVRLELLVKLFQSRLDSLVFGQGGKMRENAKRENFKTSSERQVTKSDYF